MNKYYLRNVIFHSIKNNSDTITDFTESSLSSRKRQEFSLHMVESCSILTSRPCFTKDNKFKTERKRYKQNIGNHQQVTINVSNYLKIYTTLGYRLRLG